MATEPSSPASAREKKKEQNATITFCSYTYSYYSKAVSFCQGISTTWRKICEQNGISLTKLHKTQLWNKWEPRDQKRVRRK